jgi:hypothetical protein
LLLSELSRLSDQNTLTYSSVKVTSASSSIRMIPLFK